MHILPSVPISSYRDGFGNWCNRIVAPEGQVRIWARALVKDRGTPDAILLDTEQHPVEQLPEEALPC